MISDGSLCFAYGFLAVAGLLGNPAFLLGAAAVAALGLARNIRRGHNQWAST